MTALEIVDRLTENDLDDITPDEAKDYALGTTDYLIQKQPPEVAAVLEYAPHEFVQAFLQGRKAEWDVDNYEYEWWPSFDDDDERWRKVAYYSQFWTDEGKLYQSLHELDGDGNHDFSDEEQVGTTEWREMLEPYAYYKWVEANLSYSVWVAENGDDPLDFFNVRPTVKQTTKWLIGFTPEGDRAKFWKAREVGGGETGRPAIENPAALPREVQAYINVDANGINQDAGWPEIVEMTQGTDPERPAIKQSRDGVTYAEFKVDLTGEQPVEDYQKQLKAAARKAIKRERAEMRSALRAHKKMPHYTV